jgi:competence protein ComEC
MFLLTKSKIFFFSCLFFIAGIIVGNFFIVPDLYLLIVSIFSLMLAIIAVADLRILFIFLFCFFLGWWRFVFTLPDYSNSSQIFNYVGERLIFQGEIKKADSTLSGWELVIQAEQEVLKNKKLQGQVWLSVPGYGNHQPGDYLEIEAYLRRPGEPGSGFSNYLFKENIYITGSYPKLKKVETRANWRTYLFLTREKLKLAINDAVLEPAASLLNGILLGDKKNIPTEIKNSFSELGLSHIIAISGTHLAILIAVLMQTLNAVGLSRRKTFLPATIIIILYVLMVGAPASAVRSALMALSAMLAGQFSRLSNSLNALICASVIMSFLNPKIILSDVGFQFSFMAVVGLIYFSPLLEKLLQRFSALPLIKGILVASLSAQLTVYPLSVFYFGNFSWLSFLSNLLVLPTVPLIMTGGLLIFIFSFFLVPVAQLIGYFLYLIISYWLKIGNLLLTFPLAVFKIENFDLKWLFLSYFLLFFFYLWLKKRSDIS